jgi:hypothetical protein
MQIWPKDNKCPILGTPFVLSIDRENPDPASPSVDRINATLDYVPGNIKIISARANIIKNKATAEQLRKVAKWVHNNGATPDFLLNERV